MSNKHSYRSLSRMFIGSGLIAFGVALWFALVPESREKTALTIPVSTDFPAPDLLLFNLSGVSNSLVSLSGRVILVNIWATWCPPCKAEMPALNNYYQLHRSKGFVIVGINNGEPVGLVRNFIDSFNLEFPIWLDPEYKAEKAFGTIILPSSYVIDRIGRVRLMWFGAVDLATLDRYVSPIIME